MDTRTYQLKITFATPILGTQPAKDVATKYLMTKIIDQTGEAPADELETLPDKLDKGTTVFNKLGGIPLYFNYHLKGFIKEVGGAFNGLHDVKNLKSKIENYVFPTPRSYELHLPETMWYPHELVTHDPKKMELSIGGSVILDHMLADPSTWPNGGQPGFIFAPAKLVYLERPLRAMTAQGPRTTLARSEMLPAGTWFEAMLKVYKKEITEAMLREIFDFGIDKGLGQWRNSSSYGTFGYEMSEVFPE